MKAINSHAFLPKWIVVILDDNLVCDLDRFDAKDQYVIAHHITDWIVHEFDHALQSYKDYLPCKVKRPKFPQFLCFLPPTHKNFGSINNNLRTLQQAHCLEEIIQTKDNMAVLKKIWDHKDGNNFLRDIYRFTSEDVIGHSKTTNKKQQAMQVDQCKGQCGH